VKSKEAPYGMSRQVCRDSMKGSRENPISGFDRTLNRGLEADVGRGPRESSG
jgi:hypothetical protein